MQNTSITPIAQIIAASMPKSVSFKPNNQFYKLVGINKHRFAKILRGKIDPTLTELRSLSLHFNIPADRFFQIKSPAAAGNSAGQSVNV